MFIGDSYRVPGKVRWTYILIALNLISFYVVMYRMNATEIFAVGGIIPAEWFGPSVPFSDQRPIEVISLFWSFFLHGGWAHLLLNMFFLYLFGPNLEAKMGGLHFVLFFFSCASSGALLQVLYDMESVIPIIGASGGVAGLLGAYFVLFKDHFILIDLGTRARQNLVFPFYIIILFWLISQVVHGLFPLLLKGPDQFQPVAYFAHIGGFACGYLLARNMISNPKSASRFKVFRGGRS